MKEIDFSNILQQANQIMKYTFNFSVILLTIILIISLVIWLIGIHIKSEKAIKSGIKTSISILLLLSILIIIVIVIADFRMEKG